MAESKKVVGGPLGIPGDPVIYTFTRLTKLPEYPVRRVRSFCGLYMYCRQYGAPWVLVIILFLFLFVFICIMYCPTLAACVLLQRAVAPLQQLYYVRNRQRRKAML